jgi:hypothetical protein
MSKPTARLRAQLRAKKSSPRTDCGKLPGWPAKGPAFLE